MTTLKPILRGTKLRGTVVLSNHPDLHLLLLKTILLDS